MNKNSRAMDQNTVLQRVDKRFKTFKPQCQMLQEQSLSLPKKKNVLTTKGYFSNFQNVSGSNIYIESFNFNVQQAFDPQNPTVAWAYTVPVLRPNQKSIYLITQQFQTVVTDFMGDDFPHSISFTLQGFNGYIDKNGTPTPKFLVMDLVGTTVKPSQYATTRDLIYKSQMSNQWELGSLRSLKMQIYLDQQSTPIQLPLGTPIQVSFKIIHVSI